jgi:hypothetical protein
MTEKRTNLRKKCRFCGSKMIQQQFYTNMSFKILKFSNRPSCQSFSPVFKFSGVWKIKLYYYSTASLASEEGLFCDLESHFEAFKLKSDLLIFFLDSRAPKCLPARVTKTVMYTYSFF